MKSGVAKLPFAVMPSYSSLILHPSSFLSVSAKKLLNVRILSLAQSFIGTAKNYLAVFHHHYFAVGQAKAFAFPLTHDLSFFVYNVVLRAKVIQVVHFISDGYGRHIFQIAQLNGQLANSACSWRIEAGCWFVEEHDLRIADKSSGDTDAPAHAA